MHDPNLFPAAYSDLCPGTQTQERDRIAELEAKLLILRNQLLAGDKRQGQSIGELQNSTITTTTDPTLLTTGRSYFAGGFLNGSSLSGTERLNHSNEVISILGVRLTNARFRHYGFASSATGFWCGGCTSLAAAVVNSVEGLVFDGENKAVIGFTLSSAIAYGRGAESQTKGYAAGGQTGDAWVGSLVNSTWVGTVQALTFSTNTFATLGTGLSTNTGATTATKSATKAFFAGGVTSAFANTTAISRLTFSSDAIAAISATLAAANRSYQAGFSSKADGYIAGSFTGSQTIEAINFALETTSLVANALVPLPAQSDAEGASALRKGYILGGVAYSAAIAAFDFGLLACGLIGQRLATPRAYPVGVTKN